MGLKSKERRSEEIPEEEKLAKIPKTEDDTVISSEVMKNALEKWTCYHDMAKIVEPWVDNAILEKMPDRGYKNRSQVYEDFCILNSLHAKLKAERQARILTIALYEAEILHTYALKTKYKILVSFERMLEDTTDLSGHENWIRQKLENRNTKKFLKKFKGDLKVTRSHLKDWGGDVKSAVEEKTKKKLQLLRSYSRSANEFHAGNFDDRKKEFESVEKEIADGSACIDAVIESCETFGVTLRRVKLATGGLMRRVFFHLPADNDQKDLVQKWNEQERNRTR
ncbi:uncharacterized protein LOC113360817 isoform X2 [Papaver somniferum]|uniref:uncharacterized protein LOC113352907 isoform X2 n=1 Tax=Papaver somniferum TaxID=3469 RepID=UPI000E6FFC80|nr:uncharacterized protein LOC113352907 isoform X2 [Papaver somniferum]XP_026460061.1 uncharacterized protein LOC113360817 isoform X2 [Papaver somniferum]